MAKNACKKAVSRCIIKSEKLIVLFFQIGFGSWESGIKINS